MTLYLTSDLRNNNTRTRGTFWVHVLPWGRCVFQGDSVHGCWPLTTWTLCTHHGCRPARAFQRRKSIRGNETSRDLRVPLRPPAQRQPYLLLLRRRHLRQVSYGFFYVTRVPLDRLLHPSHGGPRGKFFFSSSGKFLLRQVTVAPDLWPPRPLPFGGRRYSGRVFRHPKARREIMHTIRCP